MQARVGTAWRTKPLPKGWTSRIVPRILARDRGICYVCRQPGATEVDHVIPASDGGSDDDSNLKAICRRDHRIKTGREGQAARPQRKRKAEPHPGFL